MLGFPQTHPGEPPGCLHLGETHISKWDVLFSEGDCKERGLKFGVKERECGCFGTSVIFFRQIKRIYKSEKFIIKF